MLALRLCVALFAAAAHCMTWQQNSAPRIFIQPREWRDYSVFRGNLSVSDHFTVLLADGTDSILVGGRNILYKLSVKDLKLEQHLVWTAKDTDAEVCIMKGKSAEVCQNYIKVLKKYKNDSGRFKICGTNAYKPICREYVDDAGSYLMTSNEESGNGVGYCPYSPHDNSTAVLVDDKLFAGTTGDTQGVDALIYSSPLRTPQFDSTFLNKPSFVGSFAESEYVYFFFREDSMEYMNCGKRVYSRVARICKNDAGGTRALNNKWTSFLKSRLNCSVPGDFPFYFDEIQDISEVVQGSYKGDKVHKLIYAVFSTPENSIGGSALCAFSLDDIEAAFNGKFKEQASSSQNWLAVDPHKVPSPRPGTCTNNSKADLSDSNMNFIKTHPLMNSAVQSFFPTPLLIRTGMDTGFTSVAVDPQISSSNGEAYDVIFVGTRSGRLLKSVNTVPSAGSGYKPILIEEIEAVGGPVLNIEVINSNRDHQGGEKRSHRGGHVVIASSDEIRSFPLHRCDKATTCHDCVALQDPYCAWNTRLRECSSSAQGWSKGSHGTYLQSIHTGVHKGCPHMSYAKHKSRSKHSPGTVINSIIQERNKEEKLSEHHNQNIPVAETDDYPYRKVAPELYTLDTLAISVSAGAVAALLVGFISGYCCGRNCGKDPNSMTGYRDTEYEYLEQRQLPSRPLPANPPTLQPLLAAPVGGIGGPGGMDTIKQAPPSSAEETVYAEPILVNHTSGLHQPMNPLGTTLGPPPPKPFPSGVGVYAHNKFNTISNVNKRGINSSRAAGGRGGMFGAPGTLTGALDDGGLVNHYERGRLGGGVGKVPTSTIYHMGTLSKGVKGVVQDQSQVVDSAYGTTRSIKKVYL